MRTVRRAEIGYKTVKTPMGLSLAGVKRGLIKAMEKYVNCYLSVMSDL